MHRAIVAAWRGLRNAMPAAKSAQTYTLDQFGNLRAALFGATASHVPVSPQKAVEITAFLCGLRVIAEGLAQMPVVVKRRQGERTERDPAHWLARLLDRPNEWQSSFEFKETMALICALDGNFYAFKVRDPRGQVSELLPLPPGATSVRRDGWDLVFTVGDGNRIVGEFGPSDIFHVRGPSLDTFRGLEPWRLAREALGLSSALERQQAKLAGNGGRPTGILSTDQDLPPAKREEIREAWNAAFGAGGEGGVAVLDLGWKFDKIAQTGVEMQHLESREHQVREIARALRVFPQMLMADTTSSTFASAEQFFRAHDIHTLGPWKARFQAAIRHQLLSGEPEIEVDFDEQQMLRADLKDQAEYFAKALGVSGRGAWMTPNEVRQALGQNPLDDPAADRLNPPDAALRQGDAAAD